MGGCTGNFLKITALISAYSNIAKNRPIINEVKGGPADGEKEDLLVDGSRPTNAFDFA